MRKVLLPLLVAVALAVIGWQVLRARPNAKMNAEMARVAPPALQGKHFTQAQMDAMRRSNFARQDAEAREEIAKRQKAIAEGEKVMRRSQR